jgi:acyl-CoA synthetase (AMP-forming)/AMP-acid ligase II
VLNHQNNVAHALSLRARQSPHRGALLRKRRGVWESQSWAAILNDTLRVYDYFSGRLNKRSQIVALMLGNRSEWMSVELALHALGHTVLPI